MRLEPSWRQGAGMALILLLIAGWAVLAVSLAPVLLGGAPRWAQALYYLVAGIAWILPLRPLLRWMQTGKWRE